MLQQDADDMNLVAKHTRISVCILDISWVDTRNDNHELMFPISVLLKVSATAAVDRSR